MKHNKQVTIIVPHKLMIEVVSILIIVSILMRIQLIFNNNKLNIKMDYKKGDKVSIKDGTTKKIGIVIKDGIDSKNRIRVMIANYPRHVSISLDTTKELHIIKKL